MLQSVKISLSLLFVFFLALVYRSTMLVGDVCRNLEAVSLLQEGELSSPFCDGKPAEDAHLRFFAAKKKNELSEQVQLFSSLDRGQQTHPYIVHAYGTALIDLGLFHDAVEFWKAQSNYAGLTEQAFLFFEQQNYEPAMQFAQTRVSMGRLYPEDWQLFWLMIQLELVQDYHVESLLSLIKSALRINPDTWFLFARTGRALWELNDYESSNLVYKEGVRRFPEQTELWFGLARNTLQSDEIDDNLCFYLEQVIVRRESSFACEQIQHHCLNQVSRETLSKCE